MYVCTRGNDDDDDEASRNHAQGQSKEIASVELRRHTLFSCTNAITRDCDYSSESRSFFFRRVTILPHLGILRNV